MDSAGICWNLLDSAGIHWTPLESTGLHWNPLDSAGICQTLLESAGLCRTLLESTGICWTLLDSAGLCWNPPDSAGQVCWTLSGWILQILAESGDFRWILADSLQTGHVNLAHVTLTKSGIWVRRNLPESNRSCGGVYSPPCLHISKIQC